MNLIHWILGLSRRKSKGPRISEEAADKILNSLWTIQELQSLAEQKNPLFNMARQEEKGKTINSFVDEFGVKHEITGARGYHSGPTKVVASGACPRDKAYMLSERKADETEEEWVKRCAVVHLSGVGQK